MSRIIKAILEEANDSRLLANSASRPAYEAAAERLGFAPAPDRDLVILGYGLEEAFQAHAASLGSAGAELAAATAYSANRRDGLYAAVLDDLERPPEERKGLLDERISLEAEERLSILADSEAVWLADAAKALKK